MDPELEETYFRWLCAKINPMDVPEHTYDDLLRVLHNTEFVWVILEDRNRAGKGQYLRYYFKLETGIEYTEEWRYSPCSVLEMLIALAEDANFQTEDPVRDWFWEFINNLKLGDFVDGNCDFEAVSDILDKFMWRTYGVTGHGGLFPIRGKIPRDERKVEIWYQFFDYLEAENRMIV